VHVPLPFRLKPSIGDRLLSLGPPLSRADPIVGLSTMSETNPSERAGKPPERRKLLAIVYMDMVGYSRLIGLDDASTLSRLRNLRATVI